MNEHIVRARSDLRFPEPFFGTLLLGLALIHDSKRIKTMATDGKSLFYNEKFVAGLFKLLLVGVLVHEVLHVMLLHPVRRNGRDPDKWNVACDLAVNPIVIKYGFQLPPDKLWDDKYADCTWTADDIYNDLPDDWREKYDVPTWGAVNDLPPEAKVNPAEFETNVRIKINQALQQAKEAGKLPGDIERIFGNVLKPLVNWTSVLWPFFTSRGGEEFNWRRPNRGYIGEDIYLPSIDSDTCGPVAVIIDVSLSTFDHVEQFWGEIVAIMQQVRPEKLYLVQVDTQIPEDKPPIIFTPEDDLRLHKFEAGGGGGTSFVPGFHWLAENAHDLQAIVYLTDMECNHYPTGKDVPQCPVLWVSCHQRNVSADVPFGDVIYMPPKID